jgi:hypothetical protein
MGFKAHFTSPGKGTVWNLSESTWPDAVAAGSACWEFTAALFPDMTLKPPKFRETSSEKIPYL